ncbi:hypothetical protein GWK47_023656 [Chionoecetes opilio]|uniref:Uncharacterized protein n=1 Tax=Chionoecetes opilio TaxID=41210 RepID=A0A8J4XM99_CHIOP|nr:hypothetical protein GWK47_023656 [Chionoecetes opilio]
MSRGPNSSVAWGCSAKEPEELERQQHMVNSGRSKENHDDQEELEDDLFGETIEKLKDLTCAHEYAVAVSNRFDVLGALGDPVELWDTFKRETLQAAKECIGERPRSRRGFVSTETLEKIEESRAARLAGNQDQHRALSCRTRTLLGRDKEREELCTFLSEKKPELADFFNDDKWLLQLS